MRLQELCRRAIIFDNQDSSELVGPDFSAALLNVTWLNGFGARQNKVETTP